MSIGKIAANVGKGLAAGFVATLAITVSQTIEMKARNRPASTSPADAASKMLGIAPVDDESKQRFSQLVHFGYGTAWGGVRGLVKSLGLQGVPALLFHFAAIYGTALVMLPALEVAPPVSEWGSEELAVDGIHHLIYAIAANQIFEELDKGA